MVLGHSVCWGGDERVVEFENVVIEDLCTFSPWSNVSQKHFPLRSVIGYVSPSD